MKKRIDILLVESGFAEDAGLAQRLVMAGQVRVNGQVVQNPAVRVEPESVLAVESGPRFVSRGGEKLDAALHAFHIAVEGRVCADVGASTGGFTDCLLQSGAVRVYAIDVGRGILEWKLRQDTRVIVMEGTNARQIDRLPDLVSLITIDASFISLKVLLPVVRGWLTTPGEVVALIKPQFEAGRKQAARTKGVIRDPEIHREILMDVLAFSQQEGYEVRAVLRSPLVGPKGNVEFLAHLGHPVQGVQKIDKMVTSLIDAAGGNP
jgi:23S rRNA (cytidine1920-2'-O)/16S rRNA (cytidine1409-2'-O)-methyltransferase